MQTPGFVSGLHNCREFSQPLECLDQAMQTQEKSFLLLLEHWLKEKLLPVAKSCMYTTLVSVISPRFRLKCQLNRKKIHTACFYRFSKFQPTRKWVNKVNLSRFSTQNLFQIRPCVISARKAKHLDVTTMFTYSHANTPLGQSERAYYLSYFIINF